MNGLHVLVVGSGGREHALAWALARSRSVEAVDAAPGNPGTARHGRRFPVPAADADALAALVAREGHDLVVIGPEAPLAAGVADRLRERDIAVFGPGAEGTRMESSKAFAKSFMEKHKIPTAGYRVVRTMVEAEEILERWGAPVVVKASGLAAGKGVTVAETLPAARRALEDCLRGGHGEAGRTVVLERMMVGEEVSVFVITDGERYKMLPVSQDHKRAFDGDRGPNTGGMGAYSPAPMFTDALRGQTEREIIRPALQGLRAEGIDFRGLLYAGLMLTPRGPRVVEFNARFGDPETQAVLPRLRVDWGELLFEAARGELDEEPLPEPERAASVCVVAATRDYPESSESGLAIRGVAEAEATGALVFHAGTETGDGGLVTAGGRVLGVTATADSLREAVSGAYAALDHIDFDGMRFRRDIAYREL